MRVSNIHLVKPLCRAAAASICGVVFAAAAVTTFAGTPTPTPTPLNGTAPSGSNPPAGRFYGAVTASGQPASDGTNVMAMSSSGATCGTVNVGDPPASSGTYVLDDAGSDPGCSTPGSTLTFSVSGQNANTSVTATVPDGNGAIHVDLSTP
jgi:hypothetical protein